MNSGDRHKLDYRSGEPDEQLPQEPVARTLVFVIAAILLLMVVILGVVSLVASYFNRQY